ncbi:DUF1327 domain-containing protein [Escherichia coli]|uniref:DUF1327 domain-containing protein n=1 Tax=Escherichia coli TaxID=562 RepID=UPI0034586AEA
MTQNYELIVKGIRNFENKVTVTLALRDKKRFDGEIFDLDISLDRVEGAALEFYEAAARRSIRQVFLDVAAGLCEGDAYSALFDHGLASKSDQRFASIRSTGNLTFSTAF